MSRVARRCCAALLFERKCDLDWLRSDVGGHCLERRAINPGEKASARKFDSIVLREASPSQRPLPTFDRMDGRRKATAAQGAGGLGSPFVVLCGLADGRRGETGNSVMEPLLRSCWRRFGHVHICAVDARSASRRRRKTGFSQAWVPCKVPGTRANPTHRADHNRRPEDISTVQKTSQRGANSSSSFRFAALRCSRVLARDLGPSRRRGSSIPSV